MARRSDSVFPVDPLGPNAQPNPPLGQLGHATQSQRSKRSAVIRPDRLRQVRTHETPIHNHGRTRRYCGAGHPSTGQHKATVVVTGSSACNTADHYRKAKSRLDSRRTPLRVGLWRTDRPTWRYSAATRRRRRRAWTNRFDDPERSHRLVLYSGVQRSGRTMSPRSTVHHLSSDPSPGAFAER